jgi:hypothetical protein
VAREEKRGVEHVPMESTEQTMLFQWIRAALPGLIAYAVPNGGKRSLRTAVRMKKEGVTAGVPDVVINKARGIYHGMFIELKRRKGGSLSEGQKEMIRSLRSEGYHVVVAKGFDEARDAVLAYLEMGEPVYG